MLWIKILLKFEDFSYGTRIKGKKKIKQPSIQEDNVCFGGFNCQDGHYDEHNSFLMQISSGLSQRLLHVTWSQITSGTKNKQNYVIMYKKILKGKVLIRKKKNIQKNKRSISVFNNGIDTMGKAIFRSE